MPVALSKLQQKMRARLEGAQFRYLNETLYTQSGADSFSMMKQAPELFSAYHAGYRKQVEHWPENPLDVIIGILRREHALHSGSGGGSGGGGAKRPRPAVEAPDASAAKPPATKRRVIADFGCGEARLAATLSPLYTVHSFDLVCPPGNPYITACDMAAVPLATNAADYAVFCLSLMGTDYIKFLAEAHRVLKPGARLIVAEVRSRFVAEAAGEGSEGGAGGGKGEHHHHPHSRHPGRGGKQQHGGRGGPDGGRLAGTKRPREDDDKAEDGGAGGAPQAISEEALSAFTGAVAALGFTLDDMDKSNTMFVLMSFTKNKGSDGGGGADGAGDRMGVAASASAPGKPTSHGGPHKSMHQHQQHHQPKHGSGGGGGSGGKGHDGSSSGGAKLGVGAPPAPAYAAALASISAPALKACKYKRR